MLRETLYTARLKLRRPSTSDAGRVFEVHSDPRACEHNPADALKTRREAAELLRRWDEHWKRHGYGYFSVESRADDTLMGFCGVKLVDLRGRRALNLFYRFDPEFWGRGFATEAARCVIEYADGELADLPVIARVRPSNIASRHIVLGLGMSRDSSLDLTGEDGFEEVYTRRWSASEEVRPSPEARGPG